MKLKAPKDVPELSSQPYVYYLFTSAVETVMNQRKKNGIKSSEEGFQREGTELVIEQQNGLGNSCLRNVPPERMSRAEQAQPWVPGYPMFRRQGLGLLCGKLCVARRTDKTKAERVRNEDLIFFYKGKALLWGLVFSPCSDEKLKKQGEGTGAWWTGSTSVSRQSERFLPYEMVKG